MRIVWLAHEGSRSGANLCLLEYLQILKAKGVQNYLIVPYEIGYLANKAAEMNIPFERVKYYSWSKPILGDKLKMSQRIRRWIRNLIAINRIGELLKRIGPDFVATNTIVTPVAAMAAKKMAKKHVWFVHEFGEEDHGFTIAGNFKRGVSIMNRLSDKLVFNSLAVSNKYQSFIPKSKAFLVNNAVIMPETNIVALKKGSILRLIMLGQIAPSKHHMEALVALKICRDSGLSFIFDIVGKAENCNYLEELNTYIQKQNLTKLVSFKGQRENPVHLLTEYHVLLMCSHKEAFGRVTVEALKCGIPVIAANTGGSLEIIREGINGLFYQSGDSLNLANKIMALHENYQLFDRHQIAIQSREKYNEINTGIQLLKVFS